MSGPTPPRWRPGPDHRIWEEEHGTADGHRHRLPGAHQASLADESGNFLWTGRFRTVARELESLWAMLPQGTDPAEVIVVMEPTRNAWVALAAWFRRRGAHVVLVPPERS